MVWLLETLLCLVPVAHCCEHPELYLMNTGPLPGRIKDILNITVYPVLSCRFERKHKLTCFPHEET